MKEQLINFDTAKLAKEKGFNECCQHYYSLEFDLDNCEDENNTTISKRGNDHCIAPTQSLLQKWLREKHNSEVYVHPYSLNNNHKMVGGNGYYEVVVDKAVTTYSGYTTYEEALEKGLKGALKLI